MLNVFFNSIKFCLNKSDMLSKSTLRAIVLDLPKILTDITLK